MTGEQEELANAFKRSADEHNQAYCPNASLVVARLSLLFLYWTRLEGSCASFGRLCELNERKFVKLISVASDVIQRDHLPAVEGIRAWDKYREEMVAILARNSLTQDVCEVQEKWLKKVMRRFGWDERGEPISAEHS